MNQEHGLLEDNEDQESEQENEDDDQQTVLQNAEGERTEKSYGTEDDPGS